MNSAKYNCVQGLHNELKVEGNQPRKVQQTSFSAGAEQTPQSRMAGHFTFPFNKWTQWLVMQQQKCATPKDNHQVRLDWIRWNSSSQFESKLGAHFYLCVKGKHNVKLVIYAGRWWLCSAPVEWSDSMTCSAQQHSWALCLWPIYSLAHPAPAPWQPYHGPVRVTWALAHHQTHHLRAEVRQSTVESPGWLQLSIIDAFKIVTHKVFGVLPQKL